MLKPIQKIKEDFLNAPNGDYCKSNGIFSLEKVANKMGSIIANDRDAIITGIMGLDSYKEEMVGGVQVCSFSREDLVEFLETK